MTSMEHETIKLAGGHNPQDLELEEGEVSLALATNLFRFRDRQEDSVGDTVGWREDFRGIKLLPKS